MFSINLYLHFSSGTEASCSISKSVFGGEFAMLQRFRDTMEVGNLSAADQEKFIHLAFTAGRDSALMGSDALESMGHKLTVGNNLQILPGTGSKEEADRCFNGPSAGGQVTMPLQDTFRGACFGMRTDRFGMQ